MNYEEYTEAANSAALDALIDAMRIDLLIQEALYGLPNAPAL